MMRRLLAGALGAILLFFAGVAAAQEYDGAFLVIDGDVYIFVVGTEVSWLQLSVEGDRLTGTIHDGWSGKLAGSITAAGEVKGTIAFNDRTEGSFTGTFSREAGLDVAVTDARGTMQAKYVPYDPYAEEYFIAEDGEQRGPFSPLDLTQFAFDGTLTGDTLMWRPGFDTWLFARQLPELGYSYKAPVDDEWLYPPDGEDMLPPDGEDLVPPPAPKEEAIWFVLVDGAPVGPMTLTDLQQRIYDGKMHGLDLIWQPAFADWVRVNKINELELPVGGDDTIPPVADDPPPPAETEAPTEPEVANEPEVAEAPKAVDPACVGVDLWLENTRARFATIADLQAEGGRLLERVDMDGYKASLREFAAAVTKLQSSQVNSPVPAAAASAQEIALKTMALFNTAASGLAQFYRGGGGQPLFSKSIGALQDAEDARGELEVAASVLDELC